jgi:transposase
MKMKNDNDLMPADFRTNNSLRGYLSIAFLALILRMKLMRLMLDAGLHKRYSPEGLIIQLEKIKVMILPDGQKITPELTKKLHEILDILTVYAWILGRSARNHE